MKRLQKGDQIILKEGDNVIIDIPEIFISRKIEDFFSSKKTERKVRLGQKFYSKDFSKQDFIQAIRKLLPTVPVEEIENFLNNFQLDFSTKCFDTCDYLGTYTVTETYTDKANNYPLSSYDVYVVVAQKDDGKKITIIA